MSRHPNPNPETHPMTPEDTALALDQEIGGRVRLARKARGLTQAQLGETLSVSFQQIQKYERGTNRISSSALILIARALDVAPIELLGEDQARGGLDWAALALDGADELLGAYRRIPAGRLRRIVLQLARELSDADAASPARAAVETGLQAAA